LPKETRVPSGEQLSSAHSGSLRIVANRLSSVIERNRAGRKKRAAYIDPVLLWALRNPGCPICADRPRHERNYFFYYLHEGYVEPAALEEMASSQGFCDRHGFQLLNAPGAEEAIATIHVYAAREIRAALADDRQIARLASPTICPVCRSHDAHAHLLTHNVAVILDDEEHGSLYGSPALLCMKHLRMVIPAVSDRAFHLLLDVHSAALSHAFEQISDSGQEDDAFEAALRLTVGYDVASDRFPRFVAADAPSEKAPHDPVASLAEALDCDDACPICRAIERAWLDWMGNVEAAATQGERVEDLVPTCPKHVRATMRYAGLALQIIVITKALTEARRVFDMARQRLEPPSVPDLPGWRRWLRHPRDQTQQRFREAREALSSECRCPVCERLDAARDRSLALLFELLNQPRHLAAYRAGYGLCLKHLSRALALDPQPTAWEVIIAAESARLGILCWELDEYLRKISWDKRAETHGAEQDAPHRALHRFSGIISP
jgi:hypothetical protein